MEPEQDIQLCRAIGCNNRIPSNFLMCARHWYMVPQVLRTEVYRQYKPAGPTQEWIDASKQAINYVAKAEGQAVLPETIDLIKTLSLLIAKDKGE